MFTFLFFLAAISFAQNKTIKGKVTDETGLPLAGVSVLDKATKKGTKTDEQGNYSIVVPTTSKSLVFSSVGIKSFTENISGKETANISLERNTTTGDEVVVIGYQTVKRKDLTGSVSSVGAKQIKDIPVNSAAEALTGRLAGVQLTSTEGKPGSEVTIRVRGGGSITQDNSPLFIVDGVQLENALGVLSPQDIESVDVLKDASATAIYGARGSNGVVIITTKKGKNGKTVISYNGFYGIRQLPKKLGVLDPYEFVKYQYERSRGNATDSGNFAKSYGTTWDTLSNYKNVPFVDWQEELFGRDAKFTSHNISVSGGSGNTQFNFGATSNKEEGVLLNNGFDRKLFNFSLDHQANAKLKVGVSTRYNITNVNGAGTSSDGSSASTNRLRQAVKYRPLLIGQQDINDYDPAYAAETNGNSLSLVNPIAYNESEYRKNKTEVVNISTNATIKLTKFLSFKTTFGYDITNGSLNSFDDSLSNNSRLNGSSLPLASINTTKRVTYNNSNVLTYSNSSQKTRFSKRNVITALLGQEIYDRTDNSQYIEARLFPTNTKQQFAFANMNLGTSVVGTPRTFEVTSRIASAFGRINYSRDNKYLLTLSARTDGSSKFSADNRNSFFPSGSLAWKISDEKFYKSLKSVVNEAKLRVSYGMAGNNRLDDYQYKIVYVTGTTYGINNLGSIGFVPQSKLANPDLVWEKTISKNIGLDLGFLNNRITLTADAYKNTSKDLLLNVPIPAQSGYTNQIQNRGTTLNKGVELQIVATPIQSKNFSWTTSFNISYNKNIVKSLGGTNSFLINSGWGLASNPADYIVREGDPVGSMYGYVTDGFYTIDDFNYNAATQIYTLKAGVANNFAVTSVAPQPGTLKFKNLTGDSAIDANLDRTIIGNANPKYFGGFNQQFTYKNWDLSAFINFQVGNDVYNANKLEFTSGYTPNSNLLEIVKDRWTNIDAQGNTVKDPTQLAALNTNAKIWTPSKAAQSFVLHSWAVEDGSFLRINNISLGYTLPVSFTKKAGISRFRIYGTVNNLKVFTNYSGYDPEVSARRSSPITQGVDYSAYPKSRSYIFGVNVTL